MRLTSVLLRLVGVPNLFSVSLQRGNSFEMYPQQPRHVFASGGWRLPTPARAFNGFGCLYSALPYIVVRGHCSNV